MMGSDQGALPDCLIDPKVCRRGFPVLALLLICLCIIGMKVLLSVEINQLCRDGELTP